MSNRISGGAGRAVESGRALGAQMAARNEIARKQADHEQHFSNVDHGPIVYRAQRGVDVAPDPEVYRDAGLGNLPIEKAGEIQQELQGLGARLDNLHEAVAALERRIEPVLMPSMPAETQPSPGPMLSEVGGRLASCNLELDKIIAWVQTLRNRVAL